MLLEISENQPITRWKVEGGLLFLSKTLLLSSICLMQGLYSVCLTFYLFRLGFPKALNLIFISAVHVEKTIQIVGRS